MNVEMFYVKTDDRDAVIACIAERLRSQPDAPGMQPDWGLESCYDVILAKDPKRKIIMSPLKEGWLGAIESKEALDFALLQSISERLGAEVIACQLADAIGACGYARSSGGELVEHQWLPGSADPLATLREYLHLRSVPFDILTFREAVELRSAGWEFVQALS